MSKEENSDAIFANEYYQLRTDPRIGRIELPDVRRINIWTAPVVVSIEDKKRFLGLFGILLAEEEDKLYLAIHCLMSGHLRKGRRPNFIPMCESFPYGFCFGTEGRKKFINQLVRQKELFALIDVVLDSLWHLNEGDYRSVLENFDDDAPPFVALDLLGLPYKPKSEKEEVYDDDFDD